MKRLFFAFEIQAPWPEKLPPGRVLDIGQRHCTVIFLGNLEEKPLLDLLPELPLPPFKLTPAGVFDQYMFLPVRYPRVAAWHINWGPFREAMNDYWELIHLFLHSKGIKVERKHNFLPHVTLARKPFIQKDWENIFTTTPLLGSSFALYESLGSSRYQKIWEHPYISPWVEIEHTADIAFTILGRTLQELQLYAQLALAFKYPPLANYIQMLSSPETIDDIIIALNEMIGKADTEIGCPLKAVSFHGEAQRIDNLLHWEMIVDV